MTNSAVKINKVVKPYYEVIFNNDVSPTEVICRLYIADQAQPEYYALHQVKVNTIHTKLQGYRKDQDELVVTLIANVSGTSDWAKQQCALVKILK